MKSTGVFAQLPDEVWNEVWAFHDTYRQDFQEKVLPEMLDTIKENVMCKLERLKHHILTFGPFNQQQIDMLYDYIMSDEINLQLVRYDPRFHFIDRVFFNHGVLKALWRHSM